MESFDARNETTPAIDSGATSSPRVAVFVICAPSSAEEAGKTERDYNICICVGRCPDQVTEDHVHVCEERGKGGSRRIRVHSNIVFAPFNS